MNQDSLSVERVIGFDSHPDSFTAACLVGRTPAEAITQKLFHKVPMAQLRRWAEKHTTPADTVVLEASGNSFAVARTLQAIGRKALVLESAQLGKLKEAHANNDKLSAVRIGKAFLAGTAKAVWIPDPKTQERRDWFHAHRKVITRSTQLINRLRSYLSDNGVRLDRDVRVDFTPELSAHLRAAREWSARQWQVIEGMLLEGRHAQEQCRHWESLIAQEVVADPLLLSLVQLTGIRDVVAFALGAFVGDIQRFAHPRKLVSYLGLYPAFDDSGQGIWRGGIGGHGHKQLRALLIEAAQGLLRSAHPLARWGRQLMARRGSLNLAVAALARRLVTTVWYVLMGRGEPPEITPLLKRKIGKIITRIGPEGLNHLGKTRKTLRTEIEQSLQSGRVYQRQAPRRLTPKPVSRSSLAAEYGLV